MVFETSGAVNVEGLNIIKQLIRFASKREGVQNSVFAGRTWARIVCSIFVMYAIVHAHIALCRLLPVVGLIYD
jgi:hypothetical protein